MTTCSATSVKGCWSRAKTATLSPFLITPRWADRVEQRGPVPRLREQRGRVVPGRRGGDELVVEGRQRAVQQDHALLRRAGHERHGRVDHHQDGEHLEVVGEVVAGGERVGLDVGRVAEVDGVVLGVDLAAVDPAVGVDVGDEGAALEAVVARTDVGRAEEAGGGLRVGDDRDADLDRGGGDALREAGDAHLVGGPGRPDRGDRAEGGRGPVGRGRARAGRSTGASVRPGAGHRRAGDGPTGGGLGGAGPARGPGGPVGQHRRPARAGHTAEGDDEREEAAPHAAPPAERRRRAGRRRGATATPRASSTRGRASSRAAAPRTG